MAEYFRDEGLKAVAVHAGDTSGPRASSLEQLEAGDLDAIFAVDMFNEGVDLPQVNTVMHAVRPTEIQYDLATAVWTWIAKCSGQRASLPVIDYIGNHRTFLTKTSAPPGSMKRLRTTLQCTDRKPAKGKFMLVRIRTVTAIGSDGGKNYVLNVPVNAPAETFWSVTLYNVNTRCLIQNKQEIADPSLADGLAGKQRWLDHNLHGTGQASR